MPYIQRSSEGEISAVSATKTESISEWIESDAPELTNYLSCLAGNAPEVAGALAQSDHALVRVVDDLVNVLIEKNLMRFTDLPEAAQKKLMARQSLRQSLNSLQLLGDEDQTVL